MLPAFGYWRLMVLGPELAIAAQQVRNPGFGHLGGNSPYKLVVDGHERSLGAGAQAGVEADCEPSIWGIAFILQAAGFENGRGQGHGAH